MHHKYQLDGLELQHKLLRYRMLWKLWDTVGQQTFDAQGARGDMSSCNNFGPRQLLKIQMDPNCLLKSPLCGGPVAIMGSCDQPEYS